MAKKAENISDFNKAVILATFCRAVTDRIAAGNVNDRKSLGNYYCARLATEPKDALVITGFDEDGGMIKETVIICKPLSDPEITERRLSSFISSGSCPFYAAARKEESFGDSPDSEKKEESNAIFKVFWDRNTVLEEYVTVRLFEFSLLSGKGKKRFPRYDRNTVYIDLPDNA